MSLIPEWVKLLVLAAVLATVFACGWTAKGWKDGQAYQLLLTQQAEAEGARTKATLDQLNKAIAERDAKQTAITDLDQRYHKELKNAQDQIAKLRRGIAAGGVRLSFPAVPGSCQPDSAGVGNGAARTDVDRQTADDLISITSYGDDAIRQLTACQGILKALGE
jgi:prophage endopeptidase